MSSGNQLVVSGQRPLASGPVQRELGRPSRQMELAAQLSYAAMDELSALHTYAERQVVTTLGSDHNVQVLAELGEAGSLAATAYQQRAALYLSAMGQAVQLGSRSIIEVAMDAPSRADVRTVWEQLGDALAGRA